MSWDHPDARELTEAVLAIARRRGDRYLESIATANLMRMHLAAGRWPELDQLVQTLGDAGEPTAGLDVWQSELVHLNSARGDTEAASAAVGRLGAWKETDDAELRTLYEACVAQAQMAAGRPAEALEKLGYPYWLAVTQTDLAAWLIDQDHSEEAAPLLDQAIDTLTALGAKPALARAESLVRATAEQVTA